MTQEALIRRLQISCLGLDPVDPLRLLVDDVIEALREHAMREVQRLGQEIEQEPVVWMYQDKSTHEVRFQKHMRDFVDHGATYETPLYTTPPQRKPLTDQEIWKNDTIMSANSGYGATFETLREIVRAIEAAHGITGEKK